MIPTEEATAPGTGTEEVVARADLHCHSTASAVSRLGIQRSLGLPECATPPSEVYELAKRRGMDFVTITDHDTIDGCLELAGRADCFLSEELTAWFAGEPQAVHVLCLGIEPEDHEWLQRHSKDLEECAGYLADRDIVAALAHPFYSVAAPLTPRHRRRLAELFPIWEVRNGSRAPELNMPAAVYAETRGATGIGGSDDHAGVDIGRTYTVVPAATTVAEFLDGLRAGRANAAGDQGSAAKWAHAAIALAIRALAQEGDPPARRPVDPLAVMRIAERVIREGAHREGESAADVTSVDARALLDSWLSAIGAEGGADFVRSMQADAFSHGDLYRRARRLHSAKLGEAVRASSSAVPAGDLAAASAALFEAVVPVVPYAPSVAFLAREKQRLAPGSGAPRVAVVADGIAAVHGVSGTVQRIRELGVPGFDVDVVGPDPDVDRRLPAAAELPVPFYDGLVLGVPSLTDMVEALAEGRYDLVHVTAPGPAGVAAALLARMAGLPLVGSYHTELASYAELRAGEEGTAQLAALALRAFYGLPQVVLSPSEFADRSLTALGRPPETIGRWERGVDTACFRPARRETRAKGSRVTVLYAGRLAREKGVDLMADAFLAARSADPRLHLEIAGGGPEEDALRERLGPDATFHGWLDPGDLARVYASADVFLFCSRTDTFGQVVVEAGASGLPVVAVDEGGPTALVDDGRTGFLCPPEADALAAAILRLAASPKLRWRLGNAAVAAARGRTWEGSMAQLATGYDRALGLAAGAAERGVSRAA